MSSVKQAYCSYLQTSRGANTYNEFKRLLYSESDSLVQVLNDVFLESIAVSRMKQLRVCDIGGGDGKRITSILRYLHNNHGNAFYLDFVEQSAVYTEAFARNPVGNFCETSIQTAMFEQALLSKQSYDLVFLIHSIFAFDNGNSVKRVLELRKSLGKTIVVTNASNSFLGGLKRVVDEGFSDRRYELDDLETTLSLEGVNYFKFPFTTEFVLNDQMDDREIQTVFEWITLGRFHDFSDNKKHEVFEYIQENSHRSQGRLEFTEDEVALVIPDIT